MSLYPPHTLYLASGSPRRRQILEDAGFSVLNLPSDTDETRYEGEYADDYAVRVARAKNDSALALWTNNHDNLPERPVITADTVVSPDRQTVFGKPRSRAEAAAMLLRLSGRKHRVLTAVCISYQGRRLEALQSSMVTFAVLNTAAIDAYVASGVGDDKAGAYGIQGPGGVFVRKIEGSFTGVMGLPLFETASLLQTLGQTVPPFILPPAV